MAGFYVHAGAYQNTRAPNPRCCSNPGVLCPECAQLALAGPTLNHWTGAFALNAREAAQDVADMTPPTLDSLDAAGRRPKRRTRTLNAAAKDVRDMTPPTLDSLSTLNCRCTPDDDDDDDEEAGWTDENAQDVADMTPPTLD